MGKTKLTLKEENRPADLWFWNDWFSSFDVRSCSLAARGLWIDMLGVMRNAIVKGTFSINGSNPCSKDVAKLTGATIDEVEVLLAELESHNVFSRLEDGTIYNRRMYREGEISRKRAEAGRLGGYQKKQNLSKDEATVSGKSVAGYEDEDEDDIKNNINIGFNIKRGEWGGIKETDLKIWREAYPALDVDNELKKMGDWLMSNPDKKKVRYRRFITNWLIRNQDKGGGRPSNQPMAGKRKWLEMKESTDE